MSSDAPKEREKSRSVFDLLFATKDTDDASDRIALATFTGAQIGTCASFATVLLHPDIKFSQLVASKKIWGVTQMAKGYAIGGLSGFLYMWTVKKFSELRGGKDDRLNHFLGGFGVVAPYAAVYKRSLTFFMLGGFFAGIIAMSTKTFAQMEYTRNTYMDPNRQVDQYTRYPEIFVAYHVRKERHEAKQRLKELNETS